MSKRVLVIVHDFSPMGSGGTMRVVKFVRYLPAFGWEPAGVLAGMLTRACEERHRSPAQRQGWVDAFC